MNLTYEYDLAGRRIDGRGEKLRAKLYDARAQLRHVRRNNAKRARSYWVAAIYLEDKAYGGGEEGGWWYNCGELVVDPDSPFPMYWKAGQRPDDVIRQMDAWCVERNLGRPSISSVLSCGRYTVIINRNSLPTHYPRTIPHYS